MATPEQQSGPIVCESANLSGPMTLGENTICHPHCSLSSPGQGALLIGKGNIISEKVVIENRTAAPLIIGDDNVFEVGSRTKMGSRCILDVRSVVSPGCTLGNECHIAPNCILPSGTHLEDGSDVYLTDHGGLCIRKVGIKERGQSSMNLHSRHIDYLKEASA